MRTEVTSPSSFLSVKAKEEVTIGLADDIHEIAFAHLVSRIREQAPGLTLPAREVDHQSLWQDVGNGRVDLAVSVGSPPPKGLVASVLFEQSFVILHRPDVSPSVSPNAYLKATHVAVGFREEETGYTDQRLAAMGHRRQVICLDAKICFHSRSGRANWSDSDNARPSRAVTRSTILAWGHRPAVQPRSRPGAPVLA